MSGAPVRQMIAHIAMRPHIAAHAYWLGALTVVRHRLMPLTFAANRGHYQRQANKELALGIVVHDRILTGRAELSDGLEGQL